MSNKIYEERPDIKKLPGGWDSAAVSFNFDFLNKYDNYICPKPKVFPNGEHKRCGLDKVIIVDGAFKKNETAQLIEFMNLSPNFERVGIQGMMHTANDDNVGSLRTTIFSKELSQCMTNKFKDLPISRSLCTNQYFPSDTDQKDILYKDWLFEGVSPVFRFMKYSKGGQHYTHYDASYVYKFDSKYRTLFSFVIYLSCDLIEGGNTRIIKDGQMNVKQYLREIADWDRPAKDDEVLIDVEPKPGRILVFPHRLAHDVTEYTGVNDRIIIRGDLIYKDVTK